MKTSFSRTRKIMYPMLFLFMGLAQCSFAAGITKVGTSAATFLRIPVSARAVGMGNAFVSMTDDPSGLFWNPSVISAIKDKALMFDHSPWLPGIDFDYLGIVLPFESIGTIGISTTFLHTQEMLVTTYENQMGSNETFTASSMALGITYSRALTDRFAIGGTIKYIRESIYNSASSGLSFDIGTIFVTPFAGIRLGASISNFGTKMKMDGEDLNVRVDIAPDQEGNNQSIVGRIITDEFDQPLIMRIGISGEIIQTDMVRLTFSVDGVNPNDNAQSVNLGCELGLLNELLLLRVGYRDMFLAENEFGTSAGIGLHGVKLTNTISISLDYGYQPYKHLGSSNRFTFCIRF
ncbi:MAG: PorV/PorQ family protein [Ignavibacteriae bacterium]|nr:MAG: PorV/PorQ family protein [Ignavibacteriota bacterium]